MPAASKGMRIAIDRGGTFTDIIATGLPGHDDAVVLKLLSEDPGNYPDAPIEGIRRLIGMARGSEVPRGEPLDVSMIESIRMGTTVATNALLQRRGTRCALVTTAGFADLLSIGTQSRPKIFQLAVTKPDMLYERVVEVEERVTPEEFSENRRTNPEAGRGAALDSDENLVRCQSGDVIRVLQKIDERKVRLDLQKLYDNGFRSIAIAFAHSYIYPDHERAVADIARSIGFTFCSLSSEVSPSIKLVSRGLSATADAYLTPETRKYIDGFRNGFKGALEGDSEVRCDFMMSDGGLTNWRSFTGVKAVLSGPAGGYVGFARSSYSEADGRPVIGFDMGGTSTDVSRFGGSFEHVFESTTAGVTLQAPQLDINTVAAGGGSILEFRDGLFHVGPESAGAHPGPACYRKGGPLAVTDANLLLGRLLPGYFPAMFGPNEDQPLDKDATLNRFQAMAEKVKGHGGGDMSVEDIALGFIDVANETMARPIRALTQARGYEPSAHRLSVFGGAGGQHACDMARILGINSVIIHKYSSILSAYGMDLAELTDEAMAPTSEVYGDKSIQSLLQRAEGLKATVTERISSQGVDPSAVDTEIYLSMRWKGTDTNLMILQPTSNDFASEFETQFKREFSYLPEGRDILVDAVRVRGRSQSQIGADLTPFDEMDALARGELEIQTPTSKETSSVYFKGLGWTDAPIFLLGNLPAGSRIQGPALIIDNTQTLLIQPDCVASVFTRHVVIDIVAPKNSAEKPVDAIATEVDLATQTVDPVLLSVFGHRFMSIAEQMGRTLQKTCVSVAIKERLDFSCALFDESGGLCANAPHVPVHLGSMQGSVRYQHEKYAGSLRPGDVLVTNHPQAGGTHLPDITVVSPAFDSKGERIVFYVASRAHHLDIGGLGGNSMHPDATELWEEGAAVKSFKLISGGRWDEEGIRKILIDEPAQYPGCYGSRHLEDNLSDLRAQVAANARGVDLITSLIAQYGEDTVRLYMGAIQATAEASVRRMLKATATKLGPVLQAEDYFDDGSRINLKVTIDPNDGSADFDFTGTSPQVYGNSNAPPSITMSATIYTLRLLLDSEIPMNQGVLAPVRTVIPENTIINPSEDVAVSTGNALTSQRLVDVILKTFQASSGSQGCMNCLSMFGGAREDGGYDYAYGETVCGGNGAGPWWDGSEVPTQVHMTNTRATDIEVLEKRYPLIMREFSVRHGSGGKGLHHGGNGARRIFEAREPLHFSFMSERRTVPPYGLAGGESGQRGMNLRIKKTRNGGFVTVNLGPRSMFVLQPGEQFIINTPGGGGWGSETAKIDANAAGDAHVPVVYGRAAGSVAAWQELQEGQ